MTDVMSEGEMVYMTGQKKTSRAVKSKKYVFLRLSKDEILDIIVSLNFYLDNEAGLFKGTETRIIRLRNRLQKLEQSG
jgi:hypothetical protein